MNISIEAGTLVSKIALYNSCNDTVPLRCDEGNLSADNLTPGKEYYLQVWLELSISSSAKALVNNSGGFVLKAEDATNVLSSVEANLKQDFLVYPNPTSDVLSVNHTSEIVKITLYNNLGVPVKIFENINTNAYQISTTSLPSGIYIIQVDDAFNNISLKKIIKQ